MDQRKECLQGLQELSLSLSDDAVDRALQYLELLHKWNKTYNLTAIRDRDEMLSKHLFDSFSSPHRFIGVEPGKEVVLSYDGTPIKMSRTQVNVDRLQCLQIYEKLLGADTLEMGAID